MQFFNLGADEVSNVKVLEKIEKVLKLHGLESSELIHRYYVDRLAEQIAADNNTASDPKAFSYGILTVKAYFFNESLNVLLLNARHLKSLDNNGLLLLF